MAFLVPNVPQSCFATESFESQQIIRNGFKRVAPVLDFPLLNVAAVGMLSHESIGDEFL